MPAPPSKNALPPPALNTQGADPGDATWADPELRGSPPPADAAPRLGRFEDLGPLGQGGMGEVRRVRDPVLNRTMALKRLQPRLLGNPEIVARFIEEAQVTAQLQHPGVIPVHELWQLPDGAHYFTMQEVRGRTLREVIDEVHRAVRRAAWEPAPSGWTLRRLVDALRRVAETVAYAHARGVLHRDLKPGNVMVGDYGEVLVLDWGLARVAGGGEGGEEVLTVRAGQETVAGRVAGTPGYMSPEQARGDAARLGPPSDVWSLGAILSVILSGRTPEGGVLAPGVGGAPVPVELEEIARRALARAPEDRFPEAGAFAEALGGWLEGARRREVALSRVREADEARARADRLGEQAAALRAEAGRLERVLQPWDPVERKEALWALEDRAAALALEATLADLQQTERLAAALTEVPDLPEAHDRLADHYQGLHREAEARRDPLASARYEALLRAHDRGRWAGWLKGDGALTLHTDPPGAEVLLYRQVERRRRLEPVFERSLGPTPLDRAPLPRGSWLCVVRAEGREDVLYPVCIGRGEHADGRPPGARAPLPVPLPARGSLGPDEVYVPPGWFQSGDSVITAGVLPPRRVWVDGFVIERFPVTHRDLLAAADALAAEGRAEEAALFLPWSKARQAPAYALGADGRHRILPDEDGDLWDPDWPAFLVDWPRALAFARHRVARSGQPWRLPSELEWEKAARGADGRLYPWGDQPEPTWANLRHAEPGDRPLPRPVTDFPTDVSPYGVRGLAGGVADWCLEAWDPAGPPVVEGRLELGAVLAGVEQPAAARAVRGGAFSFYEGGARIGRRVGQPPGLLHVNVGFRLVRSFER